MSDDLYIQILISCKLSTHTVSCFGYPFGLLSFSQDWDRFPFGSLSKDRSRSWQPPVWGLEKSPLSSTLQEQQLSASSPAPSAIPSPARQQATAFSQTSDKNDSTQSHKAFSGNTYDLFDQSGRGGIWSFNSDKSGLFSWDNLGKSQERSD